MGGTGKINTNPPGGTRDFLPDQLERREEAMGMLQGVFASYGFQRMQTPAFERLDILSGKYGEDEKLIFKIQKRGDRADEGADLALRYDLTVPLARFVAEHRGRLPKVFRRCQIGPVWRADRPAKGRFREFWQCDVDIVGAPPPLADVETILVLVEALAALGLEEFEVRLNSRMVLAELMNACGIPESQRQIALIALDKLDKVGSDGVVKALAERDISPPAIERLLPLLKASAAAVGPAAEAMLRDSPGGGRALDELQAIQQLAAPLLKAGRIRFTPLLARGLDYYTGMIFEVYAKGFNSAIAAGGRYDGLLAMFLKGQQTIPACGGSIGLERVLEVLEKEHTVAPTPPAQVLVTLWDEAARAAALGLASDLRAKNIAAETYLDTDGLGKQLRYASDRGIPFVAIEGPEERAAGQVQVKDLDSGVQVPVSRADVVDFLCGQLENSSAPRSGPAG